MINRMAQYGAIIKEMQIKLSKDYGKAVNVHQKKNDLAENTALGITGFQGERASKTEDVMESNILLSLMMQGFPPAKMSPSDANG